MTGIAKRVYSDDPVYYVYVFMNPFKPNPIKIKTSAGELCLTHEPFYIGKGKGGRYLSSLSDKYHKMKTGIVRSIRKRGAKPIILLFAQNRTEWQTLFIENELIRYLGRRIDKSGKLVNMTLGFEGPYGMKLPREWKENIKRGNRNAEFHSIPIFQYSLDGKFIKTFSSTADAARELGCYPGQIRPVLQRGGTCCGFYFSRVFEGEKREPILFRDMHRRKKKVNVFDASWNLIGEHSSLKEASINEKTTVSNMSYVIRKRKLFENKHFSYLHPGNQEMDISLRTQTAQFNEKV